jgi:REP element-mobilizing transposase RayT
MARSARIQFPGAFYHIWARGNHQENIYFSDQDRKLFIRLLAATAKRMNWICQAYCLMTNHYHLLLETPEGLLSDGMGYINGVYTQTINRQYRLTGHLFQERFHSKLIDGNPQFLATVRYIIRNTLEANMVWDFSWDFSGSGDELWYTPTHSKLILPAIYSLAKLLLGLLYQKRRPVWLENLDLNSQEPSTTSTTEGTTRNLSISTMMTEIRS